MPAFQSLAQDGLIKAWGVSNFDVGDMEELAALPGGDAVATNQVLYNLAPARHRGRPPALVPRRATSRSWPIRPSSRAASCATARSRSVAERHDATPAQIALAWLLRQNDMMVIPKATSLDHVRENRAALDIALSKADLAELDRAFPPPRGAQPLEML